MNDMRICQPPCDSMQQFAAAVQKRMEQENLTISELARRAGYPRPRMSRILSGQEGSVRLSTCDAIAKALNTTTSELLNPS